MVVMDAPQNRLRQVREAKGYSRDKLAVASGVSSGNIEAIERGDRGKRLTMGVVIALSKALGVEPWDIWEELGGLAPTMRIPVYGMVPARGGEVREPVPEYIEVPRVRVREETRKVYALEVTEPLADEGLDAGDYVLVGEDTSVREEGGVYVLRVSDWTVVRRAWRVGSQVNVRPAVGGVSILRASDIEVVGRVILGGRWREF